MGTVLRSAAAAGADMVCLQEQCCDPYGPKVVRGAMGASLVMPILTSPHLPHTLTLLQSHGISPSRVFAAGVPTTTTTNHNNISSLAYDHVDWTQPSAVIVGSEAHGLSSRTAGKQLTNKLINNIFDSP
eukprot:c3203_g1_i1.p1 GENE.c3203_g1_i1~~c3203_g1_i1.p1  ORF type:complete len:129 (-),score=34.62 c3203_g1_i1:404-790(-)